MADWVCHRMAAVFAVARHTVFVVARHTVVDWVCHKVVDLDRIP
jgi:hypothetical protein